MMSDERFRYPFVATYLNIHTLYCTQYNLHTTSMMASPVICYCGGSSSTTRLPEDNNNSSQYDAVCQVCSSLSSQIIARYQAAKSKHEELKKECHQRLLDTCLPPPTATGIITTSGDNNERTTENSTESISKRQQLPDPNQVSSQVLHLKHKLQCLRSTSNELAVRLTAKTMENDERESQLQFNATKIQLARERLEVMRRCLLLHSEEGAPTNSNKLEEGKCSTDSDGDYQIGGGLKDALVTGTKQIQTLRFQYACKVFVMHKIDVGEQYTSNNNKKNENEEQQHSGNNNSNLSATGVGKIGNLPLPHAGPVLYGVVPRMVLASSLRWVASLTQLVARCLGVVLPHPILVCFKECRQCGCMYDFTSDVIDMLDDADSDDEYCDHDEMICSACLNEGHQNTATTTTIKQQSIKPLTSSATSTQSQRRSSLLKLVGKSARKAISLTTSATSRAISQYSSSSSSIDLDQSVMSSHVQQQQRSSCQQSKTHSTKSTTDNGVVSMSLESKINHATFAHLRESHDASATEYVLDPPRWNEEGSTTTRSNSSNNSLDDTNDSERGVDSMDNAKRTHTTFNTREEFHIAEEKFATGLQLLQNNVLSLCFRVGVRIDTLWPAESMLLNLNSLWIHCQKMAEEAV